MRKVLAVALLVMVVGCSTPQSIKDADTVSLATQVTYSSNITTLFLRVLEAYKVEALKRAALYVEVEAATKDLTLEQKSKLMTALEEKINEYHDSVFVKFVSIKRDWHSGLHLRQVVTEYLENDLDTKAIYDTLKAVKDLDSQSKTEVKD